MGITIQTPRMVLRELVPEDLPALRPILQDEKVMYAWEHCFSDEEIAGWIAGNRHSCREWGCGYLAAVLRATGEVAGLIGPLREMPDGAPVMGIGYILGTEFQGRGLAREGAGACLRYLFEEMGADCAIAEIRPENLPSLRVARSLGMKEAGSFVKVYRGKAMPHLIFRMDKDVFLSLPPLDTKPRAVVFDMDGVLFDTEGVEYRAAGRIEREQNLPGVQAMILEALGMTQQKSVELFLKHFPSEAAYRAFEKTLHRYYFEAITPKVPEKPGLHELLAYLKEEGLRVALATSSDLACVDRNFSSAGIAPYFDAVVTGDQFSHSKPHPEIYLAAAKKLGVPPWQCVAVEDSFAGVRSAHSAGMQVVMVPDLVPPTPELLSLCLAQKESLDQIIPLLKVLLAKG